LQLTGKNLLKFAFFHAQTSLLLEYGLKSRDQLTLPVRHKVFFSSGYISNNGCEWDSNPCPHHPDKYCGIKSRH